MKIDSKNAPSFVNHLSVLAKLAGKDYPFDHQLYEQLHRIEIRLNRILTNDCNSGNDTDTSKIEKTVLNLFGGKLEGFFINADPRGYSLKIKEAQVNKLREQGINIYTDMGGYGILAPTF